MRGKFITLEGGEGIGKSTQVKALAYYLHTIGVPCVFTREPGGSPGAERIRELLLSGATDRWDDRTEALLFAAARSDHVIKTILPALDHGSWVICDRFIDSSLAYQGWAGKLGSEAILQLHNVGSLGIFPDRTFLLDLPENEATWRELARDQGNLDRFARKSGDYHHQLRLFFYDLAQANPDRIQKIDASGTPDDVTARLIAALSDILP